MSVGTPVITNDTGDVGLYIDETNGFLLPDSSSDALVKVFESLLSKSDEEKQQMRQYARMTAEKSFDFRCYIEAFNKFIESIKER